MLSESGQMGRRDEYPIANTLKGIFDKEYPTEERNEKREKEVVPLSWFNLADCTLNVLRLAQDQIRRPRKKSLYRHTGEGRYPEPIEITGFRIKSGMTKHGFGLFRLHQIMGFNQND
jgi:hypothetical protein